MGNFPGEISLQKEYFPSLFLGWIKGWRKAHKKALKKSFWTLIITMTKEWMDTHSIFQALL